MKTSRIAGLILIFMVSSSTLAAHAWMRVRYEDEQVVKRSELIVVGALKEGSVVVVTHPREGESGRSWETHATLRIRKVIKGECWASELPIVIRYGLDIQVDGQLSQGGALDKPTTLPAAKKSMRLMDTGNSSIGSPPTVDDVRQDNLWFLSQGGVLTQPADQSLGIVEPLPPAKPSSWKAQPDGKSFGIGDPEDVQPGNLQKYFESYLAKDPEAAVRATLAQQPEIAARAVRYLQHCEIQRILKEIDPALRVERLLPYYQGHIYWNDHSEARAGILAAGAVAGPYLMAIYQESGNTRREDIMQMWGELRYRACVPILIDLLKQEDQFWAKQELKPGWWNHEVDSALTRQRRDSYGLVYAAVNALAKISDPDAEAAVVLTRRRWVAIKFENPQLVEACDRVLKNMGHPPLPSPE